MVVSRSDIKRRQKDGEGGLQESPKRTKVHAQRKFAQGSNLNTPTLTPVKDKDKSKVNGTVVPTELLPAKRPNTEDFLTFLCFRGTRILPSKLNFFNVAATPEQHDEDSKADHSVAGSSRVSTRVIEKSFSEQSFAVAKAETKTRNKPRPTAAVQAFKKKYQEQRLAKQKISLTKLAQKVKGKNMVRTRSAALLEENRRGTKTVPQPSHAVARPVKAKISQKALIKKSIKRLVPKQISNSLRGGLRSGGELPPGSDVGLKTERKPRLIVKNRERPSKPSKRLKVQTSKAIASSLSDFSSDDDQPLVKKQRINLRRQRFQCNTSITTRSNQLGRLRRNQSEVPKNSVSSRPSRKTKEAAALFMEEMIGKDLKNPDDDSDYNDEIFSEPSTSKKTDRKEKEVKNTLEKGSEGKVLPKDHTKRDNSSPEKNSSKRKKEEEDKKLLKKTVVKLNIIKEKDTKTIKKLTFDKDAGNKLTTSKIITKEEKFVEFHNKIKTETKGKTLLNKSDRRHSLPETAKVMVVKRTTRQRPGNLSLDSSPSRLKMQLNEIDDKFSDSDEEPLGKISGPNSITPKQLNARKSSADRNLIPLLRKEQKNDSKKVEDNKLSEKQNRIDDIKNKSVPKKETIRKSLSEEDISIEEKCQPRNEMRSKFRKTKSIDDLDLEVKHSHINKGNKKSGSIETKSHTVKKIEAISNKLGNTKSVEMSTESAQKPKLKKGWALCDDIQDSTSNTNITHSKDTKTITVSKVIIETVSKKESCKKLPLLVDESLKSNEIEPVQSALETSIKKNNKKNSISKISESISDDISKKSSLMVSTKPSIHFNTNKNKQTNKKTNVTNTIENTLLIENKNKNTSHKSNVKLCTNSATSNFKNPSGKNSKKNNPENLFSESEISDSSSVSVKLLNDSVKKNLKSKTNQDDTSSHSKKSNKHKDSEVVCESGKSSCKSKVESCDSEINQSTVPDCSTIYKISKTANENNYNNNQDNSPSLYKTTVKIEGSNCNIKLKKEINKDGSNENLLVCKNNKNNKVLTTQSDIESQEIKISKKKKSSQKVQDKAESLSIYNKEDFIVKAQEKNNPIGSANDASTSNKPSAKFNTKDNKSIIFKVHDNDDRSDVKKEEKVLPSIEGSQVSNVKTITKVCLEPDKNESVINIEKNICTVTTDSSWTKKVVEIDKNKSNKKQIKKNCGEVANPIIQEIEDVDDDIKEISDNTLGFTRQDTNTLKIPSKMLIGNLVNYENFEIANLKDSENNVMKMVSNKSVHKEQPTAPKYIPPGSFNRGVENSHLPLLQTPKLNVELVDYKSIDQMEPVSQNLNQPENPTDINNMQLYLVNLNRIIPPQRPEGVYKLDQVSTSGGSKSDHFPNDRCLLKEGIRPNSDTRTLDNIDTKDKLLNLDQSKNIKVSQKIDEKMKNETLFGNTKEIKNVTINEPKLKVDMPLPGFQLLKSSAKAKSMLKPGTLIDIAGGLNVGLQSDSITNFMRPPLDNAMTKALKTDFFPPDNSLVQSSAPVMTTKIEVKTEPFSFGTNKSIKDEFGSKPDLINAIRKERLESSASNKNKTSVNDTWRQAFKNVKIPKPGTSNISINSDKPVVRKPLSVTALAKKHTLAKSDTPSPDKSAAQPSIPFLRQSKPFLGGSHQSQTNKSKMSDDNSKLKLNEEIDMNNLRKKEAEVEEIVRRYVAGEFAKSSTDIESTSGTNEPPIVQTEINMNSTSILNISHQREDSVSKYRSGNDNIAIIRTSSPIANISQLKEDKGDRNIPGNEITRSNSPFAIQIKREGNDNLEAVNSLGPISTQHKEDLNSTFSSSIFSGKDRTPSPSSLSRNYIGNVEEHSPRHIPIPNLPVFSKSVHSNASPNLSEAKHQHLPLPVEQTLKKLSLVKLPMNKKLLPVVNKQPKSQEIRDVANTVPKPEETIQHLSKSISEPNTKCHDQTAVSFDFNRANISPHCLNKETSPFSVDLMAKKKVNMTTEEIKKWLSDSTSVGIEHKQNCGIFDKNHCECGYKTIPSNPSSENLQENEPHHTIKDEVNIDNIIVEPVAEVILVSESQHSKCTDNLTSVSVSKTIKNEDISLNSTVKPSVNTIEMIEVNNKPFKNTTKQISTPVVEKQDVLITNVKVENNNSSFDQLNKTIHLKNDTEEQVITNSLILSIKSEELSIVNNIPSVKGCVNTNCIKKNKACENLKMDLKLKGKKVKPLKLPEPPAKNKTALDNEVFEPNTDVPTSPIAIRPKLGRPTNHRPGDSEAELSSRDTSEVSSPPPRDDVSSSNDDSPDKFVHPERRSIFHQRRSVMKVKEQRKETLLSPSTSAFSPDNESSVYAFDPDLPPTSSTPPFRRCKKDGRTSSTATDDDESTPSSASIAVQVNLDNEAVLECSTQTEMQEADDDDGSEGHLFYIPLQQSHKDAATTQEMIQGVAVKLGTEGPDQRVIMRAKLVTKPPSTFNRQPSTSAARALMPSSQISRSGKPEQKVRPLSVKPPVGTVTPTTRASPSRNTVQPTVSIQTSPKPDHFETDEKTNAPGPSKAASIETEIKPIKTKSPYRTLYTAGRTSKRGKGRQSQATTASVCSEFPAASDPAKLVEAPTFYPNDKEFQDPLEYIDSIRPLAEKFGLCRVVPPSDFKPECKVSDDMRFTAYNQYIHKMLHRWGPNVKEMMAIRKYLATQSIALTQPPWVGGMEVDLPRLYQTVQVCGGLKEVIEKKRWYRVADTMKIPKSAQDRITKLDDIYCKFLLPYDTLSHEERTKLFEEVENDWVEREKRVNDATDSDSEDNDSDDIDECIVKGRIMALNGFYRIARNTMSMWFSKTEQPGASEVETEFWRHVGSRQCHVCVHSGSIDSGSVGYGFPVAKNSSTSRHPWNLKVLTNNPASILRSLGPLMGVTVPTLHVGMLFSTCCWYRDPHGLPWIEYLHTGASKIWYGIPDSSSSVFRDAATKLVPRLCRDKTIWLASDTAMVPPPLLVERGVSLCRVVQEPGQFIIVFPKAFTSSICTGYLVSESVYFAQPSWLTSAQQIFDDIRESCEPSMFSLEKLLFSIAIDTRTSVDVLNQILPMMLNIRDEEIARRKQLEEIGLSNSERLPVNKRRKTRPTNDEEADYECDICRANLFLSLVPDCIMPVIKFQSKWKHDFPWVKEGQLKFTADCAWCNTSFTYDTMGRAALTSHAKGKKHQAMAGNKEKSLPINHFWQVDKSNTSTEAQPIPSTSSQTMNVSEPIKLNSTQNNSSLEKFVKLKDGVTEAEIMWCISTVMNHNSLRNAESSVLLFSKMFKESIVAKEMKLHKDKIAYSIVFGLAPYFKSLLKLSIMNNTHYVIGFDESFNKIAQRTQMDLMVRFWDSSCNTVKSRYLGSVFLNQCKATDLLEAFKSGITDLDSSKLLQISMDGPNVNWAFLKLVKHDLNASLGPDAPQLLELGSCGLHVVHGAFKTGVNKTEWSIVQFLRALYNLFKMVPARRGQFVEITGSALFPHQFCNIRWIENSTVSKRATEMLPHLKKFVEAVKGTNKEPTCNSFKVVERALLDNLLLAKLAFFQSLAEKLEPFLREFQSDSPMVPFLYDSLQSLLKEIMTRFVKKEVMIKDSFFKVDVFEKEDNLYKSLIKVKEIDLGYGTRSALRNCKNVTEKDILSFRKEVRTCYQYLVSKIQEKSPLKYPLTKAMSFLNPSSIVRDENQAFKNMEKAMDIMIQANVIAASDAELADKEFKDIVCQPHFKLKAESYSRKEERIDHFWVSEICKSDKLKEVVKKSLILSHGNATLERGFSVNKEILSENMREDSLVAQRIIHDAVSDAGGLEKWSDLPIPKKMIHYMRNSYSRFKEAEDHRKKVTNTHEEGVYCLSHAIEVLSKKRSQLKHCNFLYTYSEDELNDLVDKLKSRIETKSQKKLQGKVQATKS